MTLRSKLVVSVAFPAGLALACFYLSATTTGPDTIVLFRMGVFLSIVAVLLGRVTWLGHHRNEDNLINDRRYEALTRRVRALEVENQQLRQDVNARLAVRAWRESTGGKHVRLVIPDERRADGVG